MLVSEPVNDGETKHLVFDWRIEQKYITLPPSMGQNLKAKSTKTVIAA